MKLTNSFDVSASPEATLKLLLDADRVIPCMPGAELIETVDERTWKAKMAVKLGPVGLDFLNDVTITEVDESAGRVTMAVKGRDTRGKGGADADIVSTLTATDGGTHVQLETDLRLSGQAAQFGRGSIVQDVSTTLVDQFANCLKAQLTASPEEAKAATVQAQKPISGFSLMLKTLARKLSRLFGGGRAA
jgi:hypothetical protein